MHIKPKKSLGQNFIFDSNIQRKIFAACNFSPCDTVLEIGSGYGQLTGLIAQGVKFLYAVEIDRRLIAKLAESLAAIPNVKIINEDILKFDFNKHFKNSTGKIKVFGNIPYYITTPIIEHLLVNRQYVSDIFLTVQKEFALRAAAKGGSRENSRLSCFIQYYTEPNVIFKISKNSFKPSPKVDSYLLELKVRQAPAVSVKDEKMFFGVIKAAFGKRRKTINNSLKDITSIDRLKAFFAKDSLSASSRPEQLSLEDFARISDFLIS